MSNEVLAVVAGKEITNAELDAFLQNAPREQQAYVTNPQFRQQYLEQLISLHLFAQAGEDAKLEETEEFAKILENAKRDILAQLAMRETLKDVTVTDEEVAAYYEENKQQFTKREVGKIAPNLLNRDFHAEKPNQKWVTDVTEFSLFGEKLYLSPILDLHSNDLVSYTISDRPVLSMVTTMLNEAFAKIPDGTNLILHSDQGWQYQHKQYQQMLREKGVRQSMSRKGNCLDNAVIENFFGLLKSELLYLQEFQSMEHFKQELIEYLDYYNNRRIKAKLKGLPPAIHRQQALSAA